MLHKLFIGFDISSHIADYIMGFRLLLLGMILADQPEYHFELNQEAKKQRLLWLAT